MQRSLSMLNIKLRYPAMPIVELTKSFILVTTLCSLFCRVSCGSLQHGNPHPLLNALNIREGASNISYRLPSLSPQHSKSQAATSLPPSNLPPGRADSSPVGNPSNTVKSSLSSEVQSLGGIQPAVSAKQTTQDTLENPASAANSSAPTDPPSSSPGCTTYEPCNIFFQVGIPSANWLYNGLTL